MAKKGVLLAETFEKVKPAVDPTGWWISEKLDGVRAYWDGTNFYSRNGLLFDAPAWFKAGLPKDAHLDGELWCGREQFERCVGIIKKHKGSTAEEWKHLSYLIFDAPRIKGREDVAYEARHAFVEKAAAAATYATAVGIRKCTGQAHIDGLLKAVIEHGGEGLMLREPGSQYARCRSKTLLKVKTFLDAEARVIGHARGKNRLADALGALQCEMPGSDITFDVGSGMTDAERNWGGAKKRWPVGTVISYKFQNLTAKGKPRFPVFLRVRADKTWAEVEADTQADVDAAAAAAAGGGKMLARQPSLMTAACAAGAKFRSSAGGGTGSAAHTDAAMGGAEAEGSTPPSKPSLKRQLSGGSILFVDDEQVGRAEAIADQIKATAAAGGAGGAGGTGTGSAGGTGRSGGSIGDGSGGDGSGGSGTSPRAAKRAKLSAAASPAGLGLPAASTALAPGAPPPGHRAVWSWRGGGRWNVYAAADCAAAEAALAAALPSAATASGYTIDLAHMCQFKAGNPGARPGAKRAVRREVRDIVTRQLTRSLSEGL